MAGLIPQTFIDDLLNRADLVDVIGSRVNLRKTGKNYSGLCPFHQEKSPSFTVEPEKQFYYCFGCGAAGNVIGFVMNYENLDFPVAIEALANEMGIEVPREESHQAQQNRKKNQNLYDTLQQASNFYQIQLRQHQHKSRAIDYLKHRGLSGEIARDFCLGYAPPGRHNLLEKLGTNASAKTLLIESGLLIDKPENTRNPLYDRFRDRIIYPIRDRRGRVIAFGGRVLGDDKPKYLNSPETPVFHKSEELYGLYEARQRTKKLERIVIVEGYMDVIALAQHQINYCVATLGTATSSSHMRRLFRVVPEVVFCFDGDKAGHAAAWRALQQTMPLMEDGLSAKFLFLPDGEDPDSQVRKIGSQNFITNINEASPLAEFFFDNLTNQVDMSSLEGRAKLGKLAMPLMQDLPQGIYRQLVFDQLAQITGVSQQTLSVLESKSSPAPPTPEPQTAPPPPPDYPEGYGSSDYAHTPAPTNIDERPAPKHFRSDRRERSICMQIVNLLLLQPSLASTIETTYSEIQSVKSDDIALLLKVIELTKAHPGSSTIELLGRIYAIPLGSQLIQLLNREQITPKEGIEIEFEAAITRLLRDHRRRNDQNVLLEKARQRLQSNYQKKKQSPT